jgi:prenylcysteine alpha-carboxyl methylesterase
MLRAEISRLVRTLRQHTQGNALQMMEDVNRGIAWVCNQCPNYQGDPENVILCGQSAGGQLGALALIRQVGSF